MKPDFGGEASKSSYSTRKQSNLSETRASISFVGSSGKNSGKNEIKPSDCFLPVSSSELVVQKKKIAEVKQWLDLAYSSGNQVNLNIDMLFLNIWKLFQSFAHFLRPSFFS